MQSNPPIHRTASSRARLPRLPVPDLHQTLQRYLKSLEPFLLEDERHGGPTYASALAQRTQSAEDFETGLGRVLQSRLQALDKASPNNWLDDNIWLRKAYHEWRAPLIVNSNWWLSFVYDANVPEEVRRGGGEGLGETGVTYWQVRRAAWLTHRVLDFRQQLQSQQIYPETTKTGVWFQTSTSKIWNTSRLPHKHCDTFSPLPPLTSPSARSITISIHSWLYSIEVLNPAHELVTPRELEKRLHAVVRDVDIRIRKGERAVPVGVLGTDGRDRWAENLEHLLSLSPQNHTTLDAINHSIIALSLDHYTYTPSASSPSPSSSSPTPSPSSPTPSPSSPSPSPSPTQITPNTPSEIDSHLHNLRSSPLNRWYDKPLTLIVESNTRAGAIGEHSPVDALVPSVVCEWAVVQGVREDAFEPISSSMLEDGDRGGEVEREGEGWKRLDWVTDEFIRRECVDAEERARVVAEDSDDTVLWFDSYGADWIKNEAKLSPDAYIQQALQLAWYRTRGSFTATYETALTRLFHNARTETVRTLSGESRAWVLGMEESGVGTQTRHALLKSAISTHTHLTRAAMTGKGIDRHLLGLRCMLSSEYSGEWESETHELSSGGESHALFQDELFTRSQTWKLSTSGLSAGHQFRGTGFGSPEWDGYGINYLAGPDIIKFGIESKHSCPRTSSHAFKCAVSAALMDMQKLCLDAARSHL
ncbi:acyltransferase ChoActase/COT/CPT [Irpex lacteus]|nr:acyltransferase ChoActase/COT/CPT [Irpex lacteus]